MPLSGNAIQAIDSKHDSPNGEVGVIYLKTSPEAMTDGILQPKRFQWNLVTPSTLGYYSP